MIQISEVNIFSVDKSEDSWAIEGEILFEEDLTSAFEVTYLSEEDEFEDFSMELDIDGYDKNLLKDMIIAATSEYED